MNKKKISVISFILALMMCVMCIPNTMAAGGAPTIAKMIPAEGAKNVQTVGTIIQLKFTEELNQSKVEANGSITINNNAKILRVEMPDAKSVNVYLSSLMPETEYTLKVTQAIASTAGVPMQTVEKKFTTGPVPTYHQIPAGASDMSDPIWRSAYQDGANGVNMKFVKDGDNDVLEFKTGWADAPVLYPVNIEPDVTYVARARVKSDKAQAMRVVMAYATDDDPTSFYKVGTAWDQQVPAGEWVEISSVFAIPSNLSTGQLPSVRVTAREKGTVVLIDDIQFHEENTDEPAPVMELSGTASDKLVTTVEDSSGDAITQKL